MHQEDSLNTETYTLALRVHGFRGLLVVQEHSVFMRQRKWMQIRVLGGEISPYRIFLCLSAPYWLLRYFPLKVFRHLWFRLEISLTQKRCIAIQCTMQNVQHMQGGTTRLWVQEKFRRDVQLQILNSQILIWAHHKSHADPSDCDKVFRWIHCAFFERISSRKQLEVKLGWYGTPPPSVYKQTKYLIPFPFMFQNFFFIQYSNSGSI